jgi:hypothetical protein
MLAVNILRGKYKKIIKPHQRSGDFFSANFFLCIKPVKNRFLMGASQKNGGE